VDLDPGKAGSIEGVAVKKFGGQPIWVWGVVLGLVVVVYVWWRRRSSSASAAPAAAPANPADTTGGAVGAPDTGGISYGYPAIDPGTGLPTSPNAYTPAPIVDWTTWQAAVVSAAATLGGSPLDVATAIARYLAGQTLSAAQQAIVNAAIARFGAPPGGLPSPAPPAATPPAATPGSSVVFTLTPSGTSTVSHTGGTQALVIRRTVGGKGQSAAIYLESTSADSSHNWTIVKTVYLPSSGALATSVAINNKPGPVQLRAVDLTGHTSNVVALTIAAPPKAPAKK
jgi:hypothetical protein